MAGLKHDEKKLRVDLIPSEPIEALAAILTYGATEKPNPDGTKGYGDNNWMDGLKFRKVYGAKERHRLAFRRGEFIDQESGYPHLWHEFCNLAFLIYYNHPDNYARYEEFNDFKEEWAEKLWNKDVCDQIGTQDGQYPPYQETKPGYGGDVSISEKTCGNCTYRTLGFDKMPCVDCNVSSLWEPKDD